MSVRGVKMRMIVDLLINQVFFKTKNSRTLFLLLFPLDMIMTRTPNQPTEEEKELEFFFR